MFKKRMNKKGFTLIELIVVIAILAILAAIMIPRFGGFTDKAKATQAVVSAKQLATAIDAIIGASPLGLNIQHSAFIKVEVNQFAIEVNI